MTRQADGRIRVSVRAVVVREGRLLLSEYRDDRGLWYVTPGGGVEHNELLGEALVREVAEETGMLVEPVRQLFVREVVTDRQEETQLAPGFHQVEIFFAARWLGDAHGVERVLDPNQLGFTWMPRALVDGRRVYPGNLLGILEDYGVPVR